MTDITTNADDVARQIEAKANAISNAVRDGTRSAILAVEAAAVKLLSGSNTDPAGAYPVPARTGNLKNARTVQQPAPGLAILAFVSSYAWAIESGHVTQWAGRGKTKQVQVAARPFADDAVKQANPEQYIVGALAMVLR